MRYRSDIDGLRAIAVFAVIGFHSGFSFLSGGFVGVDIFFVISGYLITALIVSELDSGTFTYRRFYIRRIARLLPALVITLAVAMTFGLVFYTNAAFDNLGKEAFFSAFGAANILFGRGLNYFASDDSTRPLIHLWSLGVEEQFYLVWPTILLSVFCFRRQWLTPVTLALLLASLALSIVATENSPNQAYFYPQYRAFELLAGALVFFLMEKWPVNLNSSKFNRSMTYAGSILMIAPMVILDERSTFPGSNAIWPCLGTGLYIAFARGTPVEQLLNKRWIVFAGLISYPLYLYHQPIISYIQFFEPQASSLQIFGSAVLIATPLAAWTYRFVEKPIRLCVRRDNKWPTVIFGTSLLGMVAALGFTGLLIAKLNGVPYRYNLLNPFALEVSEASALSFHKEYLRGFQVKPQENGRILFIGDSVLQQYVAPVSHAFGIDASQVDSVTRGACVLVKGVDYNDEFLNISCSSLREQLYALDKKFDYVVISQNWAAYNESIQNARTQPDTSDYELKKWEEFIAATVEHFQPMADNIIVIGSHLLVDGTSKGLPSLGLTSAKYLEHLNGLKVSNLSKLEKSRTYFDELALQLNVQMIHPVDIFCKSDVCQLHNTKWSYFADLMHLSSISTDFVSSRLSHPGPVALAR